MPPYILDTDALLRTHPGDPRGTTPMIGYIRVSTAREEMISPEIQADAVHRWAAAHGRRIVLWVADLDLSGREFGTRQIVWIIEIIETRTAPEGAREIGVWKFSRFGRNRPFNALYLGRLEHAGGALISATEQVDATTSIGKFTRGVMMELAAFESDRIAEGWKDAQALRRAQGLPNSGRPRFGYVRRGRIPRPDNPRESMPDPTDGGPERYEVDPQWGPVLGDMFRRAASGESGYSICRWLNSLGVPGPGGSTRKWSYGNLWRIMDSGWGMGLLYVHDDDGCTEHDTDSRGYCRNRVHIPGAHHSVFDPNGDDSEGAAEGARVWEAYRVRRSTRGPGGGAVRGAPKFELTGRIHCGWCGRVMTAHRNYSRYRRLDTYSWRCDGLSLGLCTRTNSVSDRLIRAGVMDLLAAEHDRLAILAEADPHPVHAPSAPATDPVAELQRRLDALGRRLDRLTEQYLDEVIPRDSYERTRDRLIEERRALEAELAAATAPAPMTPVDYVPVIAGLLEEWPTLGVGARNRTLGVLLPSITAFRHSLTEAHVVVRTVWGSEHTVGAAERMGRPKKAGTG